MASYINPNIDHNLYQAVVPQFPLETMIKLGTHRQQLYDTGLNQARQAVSAGNDIVSNQINKEMKKEGAAYIKAADESLKNFSTADFSVASNVDKVEGLYDNLLNDSVYMSSYNASMNIRNQEGKLKNMLESDDVEIRNQFHNDNYTVWRNQTNDLADASGAKDILKASSKAASAKYISYYDPLKDFKNAIETKDILNITQDSIGGGMGEGLGPGYIVSYKNGVLAKATGDQLASMLLSGAAQQQFRISAEADLIRAYEVEGDQVYMNIATQGTEELQNDINLNNTYIKEKKSRLDALGDRDDQKLEKQELLNTINSYQASNKAKQKSIEAFEDVQQRFRKGEASGADINKLRELSIGAIYNDKQNRYLDEMGSLLAYKDRNNGTIKKNESYYAGLQEERLRAVAQAKAAKDQAELDAAEAAKHPQGSIENTQKLTEEGPLAGRSAALYIKNYENDVAYANGRINSGIMDDYFDLGHTYNDAYKAGLDLSGANRDLTLEQFIAKNPDGKEGFIKHARALKETLIANSKEDGYLLTEDDVSNILENIPIGVLLQNNKYLTETDGKDGKTSGFVSSEHASNPLTKIFLDRGNLFYEEDNNVNMSNEEKEMFKNYNDYYDEVKDKQAYIDKVKNSGAYDNVNKEIQNAKITYGDVLFRGNEFTKVDKKGNISIDYDKINEKYDKYLSFKYTRKTRPKSIEEFSNGIVNDLNELIEKKSSKYIGEITPYKKDLSQKRSTRYRGEEANKAVTEFGLSAVAPKLQMYNTLLADGVDGGVGGGVYISNPAFKDLDKDLKIKVVNAIQGQLQGSAGVLDMVVINGDGSFDVAFANKITTKGETSTLTGDLGQIVESIVGADSGNDYSAVFNMLTSGVRIENFEVTKQLAKTNETMLALQESPSVKNVPLSTVASKNFTMTASSKQPTGDGPRKYYLQFNYIGLKEDETYELDNFKMKPVTDDSELSPDQLSLVSAEKTMNNRNAKINIKRDFYNTMANTDKRPKFITFVKDYILPTFESDQEIPTSFTGAQLEGFFSEYLNYLDK